MKAKPYLFSLLFCFFNCAISFSAYSQPENPPSDRVNVSSRQEGDALNIQVNLNTKADMGTVWSTITDYQHAAQFVSNLLISEEESIDSNTKKITQIGKVGWQPLSINMLMVYSVTLNVENKTIFGKLISGDVKSMRMESKLSPGLHGNTIINYSIAIEPMPYMPKIIVEKILVSHTSQSFNDLLNEIEKRATKKSQGKS